MLRSTASKVAWVGRTASMVFGLALILALVVGVASAAFGANGQAWILGQSNVATAITKLAGTAGVDGPMLQLINNNEGTNDTALALNVQAGEAPMRVNSNARVANLNAATAGRADSAASADTATNAQNANTLDNLDSTQFLGKTEKATNADKLDDKDSSVFAIRTNHSIAPAADCDTPDTWNLCAPVTVTVPAGKAYYASVWSSFTAKAGANSQDVSFCSAGRGDGINEFNPCITPWGQHSTFTIEAGQLGAAASSGETIPLFEGEYTFGTAISPKEEFALNSNAKVITKVLVRDTANSF